MNRAKKFCKDLKDLGVISLEELETLILDEVVSMKERISISHSISKKSFDISLRSGYNQEKIIKINFENHLNSLDKYLCKYEIPFYGNLSRSLFSSDCDLYSIDC